MEARRSYSTSNTASGNAYYVKDVGARRSTRSSNRSWWIRSYL